MKQWSLCEWSFLTIKITITTNKTLITNKTLTREKINNNTYLLHPNYEVTILPNMQHKHGDHYDQKGHMSLIYDTRIILVALKILPL